MKCILNATGLPLQDLMLGASVYFPPFFKAFALGFVIWLFIHRLLRDRIYSDEIWHPLLMDLSSLRFAYVWASFLLIAW